MGVETKIQWTHHTWNPWRGCWKISEGCANCYAERDSHRNPRVLGVWGRDARRSIGAESYWRLPFRWDHEAAAAGERRRVFTLSLGDWLELREDLDEPRARLLTTVEATRHLDWLMLSKRPGDFSAALARVLALPSMLDPRRGRARRMLEDWLSGRPPANVWAGVSAENRRWFLDRTEALRVIPAAVRFVSAEPLIGPLADRPSWGALNLTGLDWIIFGGESGPDDKVRPCQTSWIRDGLRQCHDQGVAPFVKQLGSWVETSHHESLDALDEFPGEPTLSQGKLWDGNARVHLKDPKGGDPDEWPRDLRIREFPR